MSLTAPENHPTPYKDLQYIADALQAQLSRIDTPFLVSDEATAAATMIVPPNFEKVPSNDHSPTILTILGYSTVEMMRRASRRNDGDFSAADMEQCILRSKANSLGAGIALVYDAMHENAVSQGLQADLDIPALAANQDLLFDPELSKQNARRGLQALFAQAEHVGLTPRDLPSIGTIYTHALLSGKKAFAVEVRQKLGRLDHTLYGDDEVVKEGIAVLHRALQPSSMAQLPKAMKRISRLPYKQQQAILDGLPVSYMINLLYTGLEVLDMAEARQDTEAYARWLLQDDFVRSLGDIPEAVATASENESSVMEIEPEVPEAKPIKPTLESLKPMELDWEPLPIGIVEAAAVNIVKKMQARGKHAEVDYERLEILKRIREAWGPDKCYYAVGHQTEEPIDENGQSVPVKTRRGSIRDEFGEEVADEYILLVLQKLGAKDSLEDEFVVADSPITQRNALYVYRSDASDDNYSWREVMRLNKSYARLFGARSLQHRTANGEDMVTAMADKARILLDCAAEDFHRIKFGGLYNGIRKIRVVRTLGERLLDHIQNQVSD